MSGSNAVGQLPAGVALAGQMIDRSGKNQTRRSGHGVLASTAVLQRKLSLMLPVKPVGVNVKS